MCGRQQNIQIKRFYSLIFCELKKDCHDSIGPNLLNTSVHGADGLRTANLV